MSNPPGGDSYHDYGLRQPASARHCPSWFTRGDVFQPSSAQPDHVYRSTLFDVTRLNGTSQRRS